MNPTSKSLLLALAWGWCGLAQPPYPGAIGTSYAPNAITAAPGQLITLIVEGISNYNLFPSVRAPADQDLPNVLAGITVSYFLLGGTDIPILEVHPFADGCPVNFERACGQFTAVSVQIPFEAQCALCGGGGVAPQAVIVQQDGVGGVRAYAETLPDQIHILTTCDAFLNPQNNTGWFSTTGLPCPSLVTHGDGSPVSVDAPAQPGEELVIYAVGLGQTSPPLQTGKLVTAAVPTQTTYSLDFNFRGNALGTKPPPGAPQPAFAGATPGYVGLYQINFVVPDVPPGTPPCEKPPRSIPSNVVESNLTVSVGGNYSFDAARICVAVPGS